MIIYVGDACDVVSRITTNHCGGNIEGSKMRESIAEAIGFGISKTRRASRTMKKRINLPDPAVGERAVSDYVASGRWQFVLCNSKEEAKAFQWFAIESLNPALNRERQPWNREQSTRFEILFAQLQQSPLYAKTQLRPLASGPGVYGFHHGICLTRITIRSTRTRRERAPVSFIVSRA